MRITENAFVSDFLRNITKSRARLNRLNNQLSSQQKVLTASDDPDASNLIMRLDAAISRMGQYKKNADDAQSTLKATSTALKSASDISRSIKDIISGTANVKDPQVLRQLGEQVGQLLDHALEIANTNFNRKYIFGGSNSTSPPYTWGGVPPSVQYNGNADQLKIPVGDGLTQTVNLPGSDVFPDGNGTLGISFANTLDRNAAIGTTTTTNAVVTDTAGVAHAVVFSFTKSAANRWTMTSAPAGGSNATISGGSGELVFDPTSGQLAPETNVAPLSLTPTGATPAPKLVVDLDSSALAEGTPGAPIAATSQNGSTLIFNRMAALRDELMSGKTPSVGEFAVWQNITDQLMRQEAQAGFLSTNLDNAKNYLNLQEVQYQNQRSDVQDVDVAEIGIKLKYEETMLDAALSVGAQIIPKSLLDFLS
jgi:flagellar hook-associated protein 3